jgi:hypothetical protein
VLLKMRDGREVQVPFARLSNPSQQLAKELVRKLQEAEAP